MYCPGVTHECALGKHTRRRERRFEWGSAVEAAGTAAEWQHRRENAGMGFSEREASESSRKSAQVT